jgi:TPR repeat protein
MPSIYSSLGFLYGLLNQPMEAIPWQEKAVEAYRQLDQNDEGVQGLLASMLSNLAFLYRMCANPKALDIYQETLEILDGLSNKYPERYLPQYLQVRSNMCELYVACGALETSLYDLALEGYQFALEGYRELSIANPKVYRTVLTTTLQSLSSLYCIKEQYDRAEECMIEAEQIVRELVLENPGTNTPSLIGAIISKVEFYTMTKQFDKAQTAIVEAEKLCHTSFADNDMTGRVLLLQILLGKLVKCAKCNELHACMAIADEGIALCNSLIHLSPAAQNNKKLFLSWINTFGYKFMNGNGVPQNYTEAFNYFLKAAENGDSNSQERLGYLYYMGYGVKKNAAKAAEWWLKAAEQGDAVAQCCLGSHYYNGEGVEQNYAEAFKWYSMAAEQGYAGSQRHLGEMYENGWGVAKSISKAKKYYTLSAKGGNEKAQERLKQMNKSKLVRFIKNIFSRKQQ